MKFDSLNSIVTNADVYDVDWGCMRYVCGNKTVADFEKILSYLASAGAETVQTHKIGDNLFATMCCEDGYVSLSYMNYNHTVCIVTDPMDGRKAPDLEPRAYEKLTSPKLTFVDLVSPIAQKEGNGLCIIYTLSDGSYIVYDGGFGYISTDYVRITGQAGAASTATPTPTSNAGGSTAGSGTLLFISSGRLVTETVPPETEPTEEAVLEEPGEMPAEAAVIPVFGENEESFVQVNAAWEVDIPSLLRQPLEWDLTGDRPAVLILHSHATESYEKEAREKGT